jgi:hypothetical protein
MRILFVVCAILCLASCGKGKPQTEPSVSYVDPAEMLTPEKLEHRDCETLGHVMSLPTCLKKATCYYCGYSEGDYGPHDWTHATCKQRSACTVCGEETGDLADHLFTEASCAGPASCVYCGLTTGSAKAHNFRSATCVSPSMCAVCMQKQGGPLGHTWTKGSCTEDKVCTRCGRRQAAPGHNWTGGSCTEDSVCTVCGAKQPAPGHDFDENGICTKCGKSRSAAAIEEKTRTTEPETEVPTTAAAEIARLQSGNDTLARLLQTAYEQADEALNADSFEQGEQTAKDAASSLADAVTTIAEMREYSAAYPELSAVSDQLVIIRRSIEDASKTKAFYEATFRDNVLKIRKAAYDGQQGLPKLVKAITAAEKAQKASR